MKMIDSPLCTFCKISDEFVERLFCRCDFSVAFWKSVVPWLIISLHIAFDSLNDCNISFGLTHKMSHWLLLNHIIIASVVRLVNLIYSFILFTYMYFYFLFGCLSKSSVLTYSSVLYNVDIK